PEPPPAKGCVDFSFNSRRYASNQAWKRHIGTKRIPARLEMLPEGESRAKRVGVSAIVQMAFAGFIFILPLIFPQQMKTALGFPPTEVAMPIISVPIAPPPPPPPAPKVVKVEPPPPTPPDEAKL